MLAILANIAGFIGAILFACKTAPQVWECWTTKSTKGLSKKMLLMDLGGNIFSFIYIFWLSTITGVWAISNLLNYTVATFFLIVLFVLIRKFKKDKKTQQNDLPGEEG